MYDGGAEPHILDDAREPPTGKSKTEKKELLSPS